MGEGEGFQIVQWDVINEKKKVKKGDEYENSGTVILKTISIVQVRLKKGKIYLVVT